MRALGGAGAAGGDAVGNPLWLTACMGVYAVAANGPCIVVQRYNRARIENILRRRLARLRLPVTP